MTLCSAGCGRKATRRAMCNSCYMSYRNRQIAYGRWKTIQVDADPVRQHIIALNDQGTGSRRISEISGVSRTAIQAILRGQPSRNQGPRKTVWRHTALKILSIPLDVDNRSRGQKVVAIGSVRRLRALQAIGWTQTEIARRMGWTVQNLNRYFISEPESILLGTAQDIAAIFNQLQLIPGPSVRARNHAKSQRWAPPLAWDEDAIDDPAAVPEVSRHTPRLSFPERYAEMRELGYSDLQIVHRWEIQPESLLRQLERYGLDPSPPLVTMASSLKHKKSVAS